MYIHGRQYLLRFNKLLYCLVLYSIAGCLRVFVVTEKKINDKSPKTIFFLQGAQQLPGSSVLTALLVLMGGDRHPWVLVSEVSDWH